VKRFQAYAEISPQYKSMQISELMECCVAFKVKLKAGEKEDPVIIRQRVIAAAVEILMDESKATAVADEEKAGPGEAEGIGSVPADDDDVASVPCPTAMPKKFREIAITTIGLDPIDFTPAGTPQVLLHYTALTPYYYHIYSGIA